MSDLVSRSVSLGEENLPEMDWESQESYLFLNPRWPSRWLERLSKLRLPKKEASIWLASSGTTSGDKKKLVGLAKKSLLSSAANVNEYISATEEDIWFNVLPHFHVGGLSIYARAHLSGAKVVSKEWSWSPQEFVDICRNEQVTLTSLVPTQVYDIVNTRRPSPESLRTVFIGGGSLSSSLYHKAKELGWPLRPTYGMTEMGSQVATASLEAPDLKLLPYVKARVNAEQCLELQSSTSCHCIIEVPLEGAESRTDFEGSQWYTTSDLVELEGDYLKILGRQGDVVKVGGELVNMAELNRVLEDLNEHQKACLVARPSQRLGLEVILVVEKAQASQAQALLEKYNQRVAPYERAREVQLVETIPRTELGKLILNFEAKS